MPDTTTDRQQLVKLARTLERKMAARRKLLKKLGDCDREIRDLRKFVRDMTEPTAADVYRPLEEEAGS